MPYDTLKDFLPVSTTATNAMLVMVHPSVPARTIQEFVAHAKANTGRLDYGSSGTGTITHLATAALASALGLQMTHVPYEGSAPAMVDTAAGVVQRLKGELYRVLAHEDTRQKLVSQGTGILGSTRDEYAAYLRSELARWSKVVAETGAKAE